MAEIRLTPAQQAVVENRGGALLVSAAAGSGKTKVLVDRLMSMLTDPDDPAELDEFLLITYTKAAAAELRGKIAAALAKRLAAEPGNRHLQRQTTKLYLTQISTVHAFCASVLRSHAHELELPADFRVLEQQEANALREPVFSQVLESVYPELSRDTDLQAMVDALGFGRDDRRLQKVVFAVYEALCCRVDREGWLRKCLDAYDFSPDTPAEQTLWGGFFVRRLQSVTETAGDFLRLAVRLAREDEVLTQKYIPVLEENLRTLQALGALRTWDEVYASKAVDFGRLPPIRNCPDPERKERVQELRKEATAQVRGALGAFYAPGETVMQDLCFTAPVIRGLFFLLRRFDAAFTEEKRRRKLLDFSDLEQQTIRLLCDPATGLPTRTARELSENYREIMVDEFQDSNAVQECIFAAISQNGRNRFMVGDVKQSIYRFRLADPGIFLRKYDEFPMYDEAQPGLPRKILLSQNFRSRPEILQAVNDVFSLVMSRKVGELEYTQQEMLQPGRPFPPLPEPRVELHCIQLDGSEDAEEDSPQKYEVEAGFAAKRIAELLRSGTPVTDGEGTRPARAGDIVILMRSPGASAAYYQKALARYGIASDCDKGGSILDTTECQVFSAILSVLDNPHQDIPLITALGSPVFGFTPEELALPRERCREGDYYDALMRVREELPKAGQVLEELSALRELAGWAPLSRLVQEILDRTGMANIVSVMEDGQRRLENLYAFRDLAFSFDSVAGRTLSDFCRYLQQLKDGGVSVSGGASENAGNAVRIMSIHKSKGLEFPIVVLADLSHRMNMQDNTEDVLLDPELLVGVNVVRPQEQAFYPSLARMAISRQKTAQTVSEELRVLYVAMTRPKDLLIMTCCASNLTSTVKKLSTLVSRPLLPAVSAGSRSLGEWILMTALLRTEAGELQALTPMQTPSQVSETPWKIRLWHSRELQPGEASVQTEPSEAPAARFPAEELDAALSYSYPYPAAAQLPSKITATQLKGRMQDEEAAENTVSLPKMTFRRPSFLPRTALSASERGTAMHLFMQFVRYEACQSRESIAAEVQRLEAEQYLTHLQAQAVQQEKILTLFSSDFGRRILNGQALSREFKFSVLADGSMLEPEAAGEEVMLQGVVDCFWQEDGGLVITDFKTDRLPNGTEERAAHYAPQLRAYAAALSDIFGLPVKACYLYFFDAEEAVQL